MSNAAESPSSTKPYLLRALYEWCTDNGFTPYLAVHVDGQVRVPREHVKNGEIVLNISFGATSGLKIGNDEVSFRARFGGVARDILVPISHITAIYARENGQGMAFPVPEASQAETETGDVDQPQIKVDPPLSNSGESVHLHAVPDSSAPPSGDPKGESKPTALPSAPPAADGPALPEPPPRPSGPHLKRVK